MNDMKYKNVVWDWNGTLLDDVKVSVDTINVMLERKHLGRLTVEEYRSVFGFPVKPYYESIGFDFSRDDWDAVSRDFVNIYNDLAKNVELTPGIVPVLEGITRQGVHAIRIIRVERRFVDRNVGTIRSIRGIFRGRLRVE